MCLELNNEELTTSPTVTVFVRHRLGSCSAPCVFARGCDANSHWLVGNGSVIGRGEKRSDWRCGILLGREVAGEEIPNAVEF